MKQPDILTKIDHKSGMTVPDGYFADFSKRMAANLPHQTWEDAPTQRVIHRTTWQKIRPYVYLAAMFMGIWCMLKMFDMMHPTSRLDIADNPVLTSAIDNDDFYYNYCVDDCSDEELLDDLYDQGFNPDDITIPE